MASNLPADEYFFTWIVDRTVIIGHNQDIDSEVNREYCRQNGIDIVRRRSGGGCVYADSHNIMMSYVAPVRGTVHDMFKGYTALVAEQLRRMGFDAVPSGRNDVTIGERKISGNAFYLTSDRGIMHGTMLYDTDMTHMLNAITPSRAKLESHKVTSVESRITTAKTLRPDLSFSDFHSQLTNGLETGRITLSEEDVAQIEAIEKRYYEPDWLLNAK